MENDRLVYDLYEPITVSFIMKVGVMTITVWVNCMSVKSRFKKYIYIYVYHIHHKLHIYIYTYHILHK